MPLKKWVIAIYFYLTNLKGVSSMKLRRDLGITQKSAYHMLQRIREAFSENDAIFAGIVEVDETFVGGLEKNKHESKKLKQGRGGVGKSVVVGVRERDSKQIKAMVIENADRETWHGFIEANVDEDSIVNTDDFKAYKELKKYYHHFVRHSPRRC